MKYKLNDKDKELIEKVSKKTFTKYEIDNEDYIKVDILLDIIDNLMYEINMYEEKIEDIKQDIQDNYKRIPISEQVE